MKTRMSFFLIGFILVAATVVAADDQDAVHFRIANSARTFGGLNQNDTSAALLAWARSIIKERDLSIRPEMTVFNQNADLCRAFQAGELDAASLNVEEVMDLGYMPEAVFVSVLGRGHQVRYALLVRTDSEIQEPRELSGGKLSPHDSSQMVFGLPWVETLMADGNRIKEQDQPGVLTKVENQSKAIYQVYFRQVDGAVVTTEAFELARELNPQLGKDLEILSVSPPFIPYAFIFHPGFRGRYRNELEAAMLELHHTVTGQQLMTAFQSTRVEKHPFSVLGPTMDFITQYRSRPPGVIFKEDDS